MFNKDEYFQLCDYFNIVPKPIESEEELNKFIQICELLSKKKDRTIEETTLCNLLAILIVEYEIMYSSEYEQLPLEYLLDLMESFQVSKKDLVSVIGDKELTEGILNGNYEIDKPIAKVLAEYFDVDYKDFL